MIDTEVTRVDPSFGLIGRPLLPNYLRWLAEDRFDGINFNLGRGSTLMDCVFMSVGDWLNSHNSWGHIALKAGAHVRYQRCHDQFLYVLCEMCHRGTVEVVPKSFEQPRCFWMVQEHDALFVPKQTVQEVLEKQWAPKLDVIAVTEHLAEGGILVGEAELHGKVGWLIQAEAWKAASHLYRATQTNMIKLHA